MRIARIIEYFPPHVGGMERHGLILSQEQVKLGHDVEIFIGVGNTSIFPNTFKAPLGFLPLYSKARRFWFNLWAYFAVKKNHKKNPYKIIHLHGDFVEAFFGGKLAKKLGIPAVLTIHAGLNKKLLKPKNAKYFKNISKIICVSQEIAGDLKSIGVPENKLAVISSGIYLKDFENKNQEEIQKIKEQYSKPIIISVGNLRKSKGQIYLIEAFKKLKNNFNSATLLLIGDGPDRKYLESQTKEIPGINFLGRQEHDKIIEYLYASDIFVLPSINAPNDREGTSTVIMEAMAAGLPVVATKVGGNPYLVKDDENGLLVEEKNAQALAQAMVKLIGNENLRQKMRDKNLEDIKQKDWPIITKLIIQAYETIL
ncbi:glycosyltransferase family 4 protein [Patescibacteria group bacterium]|nr:glycosyltransferase family 4 protein [Patescibacteria group bacterium]